MRKGDDQSRRARRSDRAKKLQLGLNLAAVIAALAVVGIGAYSLSETVTAPPAPVAAAFTRVGGLNSVQTAVDAARFWPYPPKTVVEIPANAGQDIMLDAARCAMANDAPLLITRPSRLRQLRLTVIERHWVRIANTHRYGRPAPLNQHELASCANVDVKGLSLLNVPSQRFLTRNLPMVRPRQKLRRFVVFAAAITPRHLPDVAIGLALAAHLAAAHGEQVSFVVVQPYLEADPVLEQQLRDQGTPVTGGVVLGQTPTVPEDTLTLLRRLLRSPGQQSLLGQIQDNLSNLGLLITALLGLIGLAAATQVIVLVRQLYFDNPGPGSVRVPGPTGADERSPAPEQTKDGVMTNTPGTPADASMEKTKNNWIDALNNEKTVKITLWLRSGSIVTGTISKEDRTNADVLGLWRLERPEFLADPSKYARRRSRRDPPLAYLLVPNDDIELIGVNGQDRSNTAQ
ncbi:MAG TPA: hypothetical protein VGH53_27265 [Streptosporangiaceae bacterium]